MSLRDETGAYPKVTVFAAQPLTPEEARLASILRPTAPSSPQSLKPPAVWAGSTTSRRILNKAQLDETETLSAGQQKWEDPVGILRVLQPLIALQTTPFVPTPDVVVQAPYDSAHVPTVAVEEQLSDRYLDVSSHHSGDIENQLVDSEPGIYARQRLHEPPFDPSACLIWGTAIGVAQALEELEINCQVIDWEGAVIRPQSDERASLFVVEATFEMVQSSAALKKATRAGVAADAVSRVRLSPSHEGATFYSAQISLAVAGIYKVRIEAVPGPIEPGKPSALWQHRQTITPLGTRRLASRCDETLSFFYSLNVRPGRVVDIDYELISEGRELTRCMNETAAWYVPPSGVVTIFIWLKDAAGNYCYDSGATALDVRPVGAVRAGAVESCAEQRYIVECKLQEDAVVKGAVAGVHINLNNRCLGALRFKSAGTATGGSSQGHLNLEQPIAAAETHSSPSIALSKLSVLERQLVPLPSLPCQAPAIGVYRAAYVDAENKLRRIQAELRRVVDQDVLACRRGGSVDWRRHAERLEKLQSTLSQATLELQRARNQAASLRNEASATYRSLTANIVDTLPVSFELRDTKAWASANAAQRKALQQNVAAFNIALQELKARSNNFETRRNKVFHFLASALRAREASRRNNVQMLKNNTQSVQRLTAQNIQRQLIREAAADSAAVTAADVVRTRRAMKQAFLQAYGGDHQSTLLPSPFQEDEHSRVIGKTSSVPRRAQRVGVVPTNPETPAFWMCEGRFFQHHLKNRRLVP